MDIVKLRMSEDLKKRTDELAWKNRTTFSALAREVLADFLENGIDASLTPVDVPSEEVKVGFRIEADDWAAVRARAEQHGVSTAGIIRRGLEFRTAKVKPAKR